MQIDVFKGEATIKDGIVSYKEAFKELASLIKSSKNPTIVVGPLLFWDFNEKDLQEKAYITRLLIEKINANVKILPDYRPKLKNYDPNVEMDPPNPHEAILHGNHDITILIGTHCYRTDFVIRLLKKHTPTNVVALCGLYGHPEADLSTSFTDANKLKELLDML
jgi:lipoate-protein ligase A